VLLGLILNGGAGGLGRGTNQDTYDKLEPPFLEEMMREGLPEDQELLPGTLSLSCFCSIFIH
jgi:hypothetical protein